MSTDGDIRSSARTLLVTHGPEAVTLRAIARELNITAPALYRYYSSRDALIEQIRLDVVADLGQQLSAEATASPDDAAAQLFTLCRGFRSWALTHPREFTLVFASPTGDVGSAKGSVATLRRAGEPFGRIFLTTAGQVLATHQLTMPPAEAVPTELHDDFAAYHNELLDILTASGVDIPQGTLDLGTTYMMIQFWARLYGHVTLEVFGNYPIPMSKPEALFDAMLAELAAEIGLYPA